MPVLAVVGNLKSEWTGPPAKDQVMRDANLQRDAVINVRLLDVAAFETFNAFRDDWQWLGGWHVQAGRTWRCRS